MKFKEYVHKVVYDYLPGVAGYSLVTAFVAFCLALAVVAIKLVLRVLGVIG